MKKILYLNMILIICGLNSCGPFVDEYQDVEYEYDLDKCLIFINASENTISITHCPFLYEYDQERYVTNFIQPHDTLIQPTNIRSPNFSDAKCRVLFTEYLDSEPKNDIAHGGPTKVSSRVYSMQELQDMDWTIVYDGTEQ